MSIEETATKLLAKASGGGNMLTDIMSSPFKLLKGIISTPFATLGGIGKGIWNRTLGNPLSILVTGGLIAFTARFMPDVIRWLPININGKPVGETMAEHARDGGFPAIAKDSLLAALAVNTVIGGTFGAVNEAVTSASGDKGMAEKTGNVLGAVGTLGVIGYLVYKAVNRNEIKYNGHEDASPKTPVPTPAASLPATKENVIQ